MFKAVQNLREQKGFTLIELLIVIAIIGILAAIAIPAFLGQREKAKQRALESSARGAVSELQASLDDYISKTAMVFLTNPGEQTCYEFVTATSNRTCAILYPDLKAAGRVKTYTTLGDILTDILTHHNVGKEEKSPYDGSALYTTAAADKDLHVLVINTDSAGNYVDDAAFIQAWVKGVPIFNTPVSAR